MAARELSYFRNFEPWLSYVFKTSQGVSVTDFDLSEIFDFQEVEFPYVFSGQGLKLLAPLHS